MQVSTPAPSPSDVMNQLASLAPSSAMAAVRALRPDVVRHSQGSYDTLVAPPTAQGLTLVERALVALRVAILTDSQPLIIHYHQQLAELEVAAPMLAAVTERNGATASDLRTAAIIRHVDRLTAAPGQATPTDLQRLQAAGLSGPEIVTLAQLIAFLSFQVRVLPVLSLLAKGEAV